MPWRRERGPLQHPCLEHPMQRGAWRAALQRAQSRTRLKRRSSVSAVGRKCVLPLGNSVTVTGTFIIHPVKGPESWLRRAPLLVLHASPRASPAAASWPSLHRHRVGFPTGHATALLALGRPRSGSPREGRQEAFSLQSGPPCRCSRGTACAHGVRRQKATASAPGGARHSGLPSGVGHSAPGSAASDPDSAPLTLCLARRKAQLRPAILQPGGPWARGPPKYSSPRGPG